ncbi:EamA family transporter [Romeria aff. gracilis LEGE 07310]|uniref:EamA family transporter n=1 Tax=Vasconcelosia minhoensis LEGE 07310 TaxID=915328 RepID=A0A8J7A4E4_9CYAN|nr:EamA family transporter [Romeria gracilis]MBE9076022.1 EamA family transporter [Romeria aff. gracilis LEGE 07310]
MNLAERITPPPTGLVLLSIASTQIGSAFAKTLFPQVGAAGMVFLRVGFAALILFALWRPRWSAEVRRHFKTILGFGLALSLMNFAFYEAIDRIPLGIAVTLEFIGPLGLAVLKSQRWLDLLWVGLAGVGILMLTPVGGLALDPWGVALALLAACFWAAYILMSAKTGQALPGIEGLAWAMLVGSVVLAPIGITSAGSALLQPPLLLMGLGVALLSSVVPYSFELMALRSLPVNVFGVLLSLEPMAAAIAGLFVLGETLTLRSLLAVMLVSLAAAGASRFRVGTPPP